MLDFLYIPIAWVLKMWHQLFSLMFDSHSGVAWVLSIMFLVVTVRIILFPIFVKMIKSQRAMQELQPEIAKLRAEYGSDRQGLSEAMMKLQRERGVNPLAGCLPLILQAPVFIALLHVLRRLEPGAPGLYTWDDALTTNAATANVFGAPISSFFTMSGEKLNVLIEATGTTSTQIKLVTGILIVVMSVTQFFTTKQIMKRSSSTPIDNPQMQMVQKLMLYGAPIGLLISGTFFPLGVLLYWFFNNLWTLGQQMWVLKRMPPPGGQPAESKLDVEIDRTKLAPRPGAKPHRGPKTVATKTETVPDGDVDTSVKSESDDPDGGAEPKGAAPRTPPTAGGSKPKPGGGDRAKTSKPGPGARPQQKRKKR